ncbi:HYC_CC_PP family protein [Cyclobacterium plantarum]|uniref:Secreted protein n=1 Tax=Cyclobacterium plantarum TaxID=2716263 RepID=A0ABX0H8C3_9BACT|nr:hypothetical protein [Cyclobacterium plantarum]NHE57143.1 hypothetical protein [Cyclobacterium plantarum]
MKAFKKIATLFLSLIVLLSSMSFTLNRHLCMGEIEKVSLFKEVEACKMHAKSCHDDTNESSKEDCCENEQLVVQGQDELTKASIFKQPQPEMSAVLYLLVAYFTVNTFQPDVVPHQHYAPPLIRQDIPVLIQSFLI